MCIGQQRSITREHDGLLLVKHLRSRLAETEARLTRARALEAELNRRLEEMRRFFSEMEILESHLKRRFREQQEQMARLLFTVSRKS